MKRLLPAIGLLAMALSLGCPSPSMQGRFMSASPTFGDYERVGRRVEGASCQFNLSTIIPFSNSSFGAAYEDAMKKSPSEATGLSSVTLTSTWHWIYVGALICQRVSGVPAILTLDISGAEPDTATGVPANNVDTMDEMPAEGASDGIGATNTTDAADPAEAR